uniref:Uncharacterized protein n=1 Tax=Athene cunicularia TaxID=194338 RepID=A0A663MG10_ATHCN
MISPKPTQGKAPWPRLPSGRGPVFAERQPLPSLPFWPLISFFVPLFSGFSANQGAQDGKLPLVDHTPPIIVKVFSSMSKSHK